MNALVPLVAQAFVTLWRHGLRQFSEIFMAILLPLENALPTSIADTYSWYKYRLAFHTANSHTPTHQPRAHRVRVCELYTTVCKVEYAIELVVIKTAMLCQLFLFFLVVRVFHSARVLGSASVT